MTRPPETALEPPAPLEPAPTPADFCIISHGPFRGGAATQCRTRLQRLATHRRSKGASKQ